MDESTKRWMLFLLVSFPIVFLVSIQQQKAQELKQKQAAEQRQVEQVAQHVADEPLGAALTSSTLTLRPDAEEAVPADEASREVVVATDTFRVTFDTAGAVPHSWQIVDKRFARVAQADIEEALKRGLPAPKIGDFAPVELVPEFAGITERRDYPLMVVLRETGAGYHDMLNRRVYAVDGPRSVANADGTSATVVTFTSPVTREGLRLVKTFTFPQDGFLVDLELRLENASKQTIAFTETSQPGLGLMWGPGLGAPRTSDKSDAALHKVVAYNGEEVRSAQFSNWASAATAGTRVEASWPEHNRTPWKWGMLDTRFYMAAVAPQGPSPLVVGEVKGQHVPATKEAQKDMTPPATLEVFGEPFKIAPGETRANRYTLFVGPKKYSLLSAIDKERQLHLRRVMFESDWWLSDRVIRPLAIFMLWMLDLFRGMTGNYGWAIILVVLVMRLLSQPFTHMGMKSQARVMAEQQRIKPLIDAINEKYKNDPQKRSAEIWKTYREHGVNPFGMLKGCGWMLIQMPIFFALYRLLAGAIDLRGQGFLWIHDLTAPDALFRLPFTVPFFGWTTFNILPILLGISQVFAQRLQSTNIQDPTQKQMATIMPIMFTFLFYNFAAGLSLYWFVSNLWQIVFQVFVNKKVREEAERRAHRAFDARQQAAVAGFPSPAAAKRKASGKPSWRDRFVQRIEAMQKEAEAARKRNESKKK